MYKATGIVRRVDDLGRIVIPKEIRRRLNIIEGDPLELFIDNDAVVFKKYLDEQPLEALKKIMRNYSEELPPDIMHELDKILRQVYLWQKEREENENA